MIEFVGSVLALFTVLALFCWMLVRTNGPRTFHQHHYMHEDPARVENLHSQTALNRAATVGRWQEVEARQQLMDGRGLQGPPADPLGTEYDAWLARRPKEIGR